MWKNRLLIRFIWLLMPLFFYGCGKRAGKQPANQLFTLMPASVTHAAFINHLDYDKQLEKKFNIYTYRNFYNGGGVALGDVNNDTEVMPNFIEKMVLSHTRGTGNYTGEINKALTAELIHRQLVEDI